MSIGYFGSRLSDSIIEKPDGSIVCLDAVLARTGWQQYKVSELPEERAQDLGIDISDPNAIVKLYRTPEEVFHPDTIHSFEGAAVTDNHPPGAEFVTPENFPKYAQGHVQNVRRGKEVLDCGEWPLLGDLVISSEPLLSDVKNKIKREISCGYDYGIDRDDDTILQVSMIGNHVAVVPKGRAGAEARINDSAPAVEEQPVTAKVDDQASLPEPETKPVIQPTTSTRISPKEKKPMRLTLKGLFGMGLKEAAKQDDANPEELAEAATEFSRLHSGSARAKDANANDDENNDEPPEIIVAKDKKTAKDKKVQKVADRRRADDEQEEEDKEEEKERAEDSDPERTRLHAALDRLMDKRAKDQGDSDVAELRDLFDNYLQEEEHEPQHMAGNGGDADPDLIPEGEGEGDDADEDEDDEEEETFPEAAEDSEEEMEPVMAGDRRRADDIEGFTDESGFHPIRGSSGYKRTKGGDPRKKRRARDEGDGDKARAADAAANGARAVLRAIKPLIARSKDQALISGYNAQMRRVNQTSQAGRGGYASFTSASRDRSRAADSAAAGGDDISKLQEYYSNAHGKKIQAEVK